LTPHTTVYFPVPGSARPHTSPQVPEWRPHPVPVQCHPPWWTELPASLSPGPIKLPRGSPH
uniref:Uncharacterized protein n=1 Tax=Balaenoptera musculus TaxID=9771 RepID=A0A8C0DDU0_BALMU